MITFPHFEPAFPRAQWTIPSILERQAATRGDKAFLTWGDSSLAVSFAETNAIANRLARGFRREGIGKGDRVVLFLPNCLEHVFAWFALAKLGAIMVGIGEASKGDFLEHQVALSQPKMIVTTTELAGRIAGLEEKMRSVAQCVILPFDTEETAPPPAFRRIVALGFAALFDEDASNLGCDVSPRDPASVIYTSGTTGPSKAVQMSQAQLYFFSEESVQLIGLTESDVYMTAFPLSHAGAQLCTVYACLIVGAQCILYPRFSASDFVGRIRHGGVTITILIGATMSFVCSQPPGAHDRDHKLRRVYAVPIPTELKQVFADRFGVSDFVTSYGQTEISLPFMTPPGADIPGDSCGVLVDQWFDVMIADSETDEPVPEGEVGELLLRHKAPFTISDGYLSMVGNTLEARRNLWFHTGDAVRRDADGWYYFMGRIKDAIRVRGENVSAFEVEVAVESHPAVRECAAVATPADEEGGEDEIFACVVLLPARTLDHAALHAWCAERLPRYMTPRYFEYFEALPQTRTEKVMKSALRARGIGPATWDRARAAPRVAKTPAGVA